MYLYYDADCDGKGGGHPQWGTYYEPPDVTRSYDLDSNGKCVKGGGYGFKGDGGMYSARPNSDWTPATDDRIMVNCGQGGWLV